VGRSAVERFCKCRDYPLDNRRKAFEEKLPQISD